MNVQITHPEIGLPQLTAHLRAAGLSVRQHDLNMTFMYRHLADPEVIARFLQDIAWTSGSETPGMFPGAQIESMGRAMLESRPPRPRPDVGADVHAYMDARAARLNILSNVRDLDPCGDVGLHPGVWRALVEMVDGIYLQPRSFAEKDLLAAAESSLPLLEQFYEAFLAEAFAGGVPACIGLSVGSSFQLLPSLVLARMVRHRAGDVKIVAGGPWFTAAKDLLPDLGSFRRYIDAVVIHEGEAPMVEIMNRLGDASPFTSIDGVAVPGGEVAPPACPTPLEDLAPPVYDGMPMDLYPARGAAVRLTRGCHWARCDFCHHVYPGYTEVHSSRPEDISDAYIQSLVDHIEFIGAEHGVEKIFLSDNGPPANLLHRFARALLERGTRIVWESLARFEPQLTGGVCTDLARSGCRALFFGLESCSLSEMEACAKGIDLGLVERSLETCSRAGIGNFVFVLSHPTQPPGSYEQTLQWIADRFDTVTQVIAFRFCLARFSRAYTKRREMGLRLKRGASRSLDVFAVPYSAAQEMPLERFMELTARCEQTLLPRQKSVTPVARGYWSAPGGGPQ